MRVTTSILAIAVCVALLHCQAVAADSESEASLSWFAVEINIGPNWDESISAYEQAFFKEHSAHLKELRSAGLVLCERDGRSRIYRPHFGAVTDLVGFLTENCCRGVTRRKGRA